MNGLIQKKIDRLRNGAKPRVIDLFAGCGGISLGFLAAGFEIAGAVEKDEQAVETHAKNFFPVELQEAHSQPHDIIDLSPSSLIQLLGLGETSLACDVLVGGPPCQAYARVGRAKLREVSEHPEAFKVDPRANLYLRYLDYVDELQPLAILIENVPDMLNFGGHNIAEEICEALEDRGYRSRYTILNAANYGVPQLRERAFVIACREELGTELQIPIPTHKIENLPVGYRGTRNAALKLVNRHLDGFYIEPPDADPSLPRAVTASEAIDDLPPITGHLTGQIKRGPRKFDTLSKYAGKPKSDFARQMRNWPSFGSDEGVFDHVIRSLPRDAPIFEKMSCGDEYPQALEVAESIFEEKIAALEAEGKKPTKAKFKLLRKETVPPYPLGSFPNRWWKLNSERPVRTLMAHIGKDTYSHIHYDGRQARVISVREAARLQSFPDGFKFSGAMNSAFRQIGNAVPPLLAMEIARTFMRSLEQQVFEERTLQVAN